MTAKFGDPDWFSAENLAKRTSAVPELENWAWRALGAVLANLLGSEPAPGPPYVHAFVPPLPCPTGCDEDCELNPDGCHERHVPFWKRDHDPDECEASRRLGPAFTLTERPVAGG